MVTQLQINKEITLFKLNQLLALDNRLEYEQDHKAILNKYVSPFLNFVIFTL